MKKSKCWFRSELAGLAAVLSLNPIVWGRSTSADGIYTLSKYAWGASGGVNLQGANFSMNYSWGEPAAGQTLRSASGELESGYFGGRFGAGQTFEVIHSSMIGTPAYFQNGLQVGVTVRATAEIIFSDALDESTIADSLHVRILQDHMANASSETASVRWSYDPVVHALYVTPEDAWAGNTLYDILVTPALRSQNGYVLTQETEIRFLTMADPHNENIIVDANQLSGAPGSPHAAVPNTPALRVTLNAESLPDFSVFLFNLDPLNSPWGVDPAVIREANRKAQIDGGAYQSPVALLEVVAYNPDGQRLNALSRSAQIGFTYAAGGGWVGGTPAPVHDGTLALWTLDVDHQRWVKIPDSRPMGQTLQAPITRLSVFALMGSASGVASETFVFPNPWRPHGPRAGVGSGQSGTEQTGLTFSSLPSECAIKIYTLNGDKVRELAHSDTLGPVAQEIWDGRTAGGDPAASGVYLWRVESAVDGKNGKLMIIR